MKSMMTLMTRGDVFLRLMRKSLSMMNVDSSVVVGASSRTGYVLIYVLFCQSSPSNTLTVC